jgi:hypothetical protein
MKNERGQVLPIFALTLVAIIGMMALAIDVTSAYSARQAYRTVADAAALAGAQDLQQNLSRTIGSIEYGKARADAIRSVEQQTGAAATCVTAGNQADCTLAGRPFRFLVRAPINPGDCATCDYRRSVFVNFTNPEFELSFARVLGLGKYNVGVGSVAGLNFSQSYALVTLRPPSADSLPGVRDIEVNGNNTHVFIREGDVGSNANMVYSGSDARLYLDPGYGMYYYDPFHGPLWRLNDPPGTKLTSLIEDPDYFPSSSTGAPSSSGGTAFPNRAAALDGVVGTPSAACQTIVNTYISGDPGYDVAIGPKTVVPRLAGGAIDWSHVFCYRPGVYSFELIDNTSDLSVLEPGLYFFNQGIDLQGSLIGGYQQGSEGVALVFPRDEIFKNRNTVMVSLNAGTKLGSSGGREARPALDYSGSPIQTNSTPPTIITLIVQRDNECIPVLPFPSGCTNAREGQDGAIDLSGGSGLYLAGVQYAPSDNVKIAGGTSSDGYVGQIVAWTVFYTGNSTINQQGSSNPGPGLLRLDAACTTPGTPCNP